MCDIHLLFILEVVIGVITGTLVGIMFAMIEAKDNQKPLKWK